MVGKKIIGCFLVLLTFSTAPLFAQDECELTLARAQEEFNEGHLYGIPGLLSDCLEKNQNTEWRQRAYLLLAETYLLLEDPLGAEQSYLNVLRANPEFLPDQSRDPIDLVYLSRKFTASPIFSFWASAGPNVSPVRIIHDVNIGGESGIKQKYSLKVGYHADAGFDYHYDEHISASLGVSFSSTVFKHTTNNLFGQNKDIVEMTDRQSWISIPVSVKYSDNVGRIRPYGYLGFTFRTLLTDNANIKIFNRDTKDLTGGTEEIASSDKQSPTLNFKDKRQTFNQAAFVGGGIKYKYKLDYFFVDVRYAFGLKNMVNADRRYDDITYRWTYVDDDFRLDNLSISIGYIHPFYKARKLKHARTKSVLRKIKKDDNADK
ncbi:outer membrane beta-barrel protein [Chryseolinea soli]|uniref:PorT family protein n=1 Tax=Chryseolinea soli TaxID=2321403 RepID=A0A385SRR6_9BACT|nr:outer membrane beta-barrel protein [Chryseolinea soli]AYB33296.1 PorT family protein [Chryseolinea soli]